MINSRQLSLFNRQYCIEIDTLHDRFKGEIIDPWIRKLKEEEEATLLEIAGTSFRAAKDWVTSALLEREDRFKQELDEKDMLVGEDKVEHLTAVYSNLLAAEEALRELLIHVEALHVRVLDASGGPQSSTNAANNPRQPARQLNRRHAVRKRS